MPLKMTIPEALKATRNELRWLTDEHGSVAAALVTFEEEHGICGKLGVDGLVILDYDTIKVKWDEPYGYVCRGLILDPSDDWSVVAFGLNKFFNWGESHAAELDWSTVRVYEKLDGSMVQRYWNPHTARFEYSTRFQLHGDLEKNVVRPGLSDMTWLQMIEYGMLSHPVPLTEALQPRDETWVFEVMSPLNKIVISYPFSAKLIARRNINTLQELSPDVEGVNAAQSWTFGSPEDVKTFADSNPGISFEGCVPVDAQFNRQKIKNFDYTQLHRLKDGINSVGAVINIAKGGDWEEIAVNLPEYRTALQMASDAIAEMISAHARAYATLAHIEVQKNFALEVQKWTPTLVVPGTLYTTRAGKTATIREAFFGMRENSFIDAVVKCLPPDFMQTCLLPVPNPPAEQSSTSAVS